MPVSQVSMTDYGGEQDAIARRRKLADALQAQSAEPIQQSQSVNGIPSPVSWTQGLAKMVQAYTGVVGHRKADEESRALAAKYQTDTSSDMARLVSALQGKQAQTIAPDPQEAQQSADYGTPQVGPVNIPAQTPTQGLQAAIPDMRTPMGQQLASTYLMEQLKPKELFDKVNPKDYTPESIAAYAQTKNPSVLVAARPLHFADTGSGVQGVDPITGKPVGTELAKGVSPDAAANLAFRKVEFGSLSANQQAQLGVEMQKLGLSQKQLEEGRIQLVQDGEGNVHLINKMSGVGVKATDADGKPLSIPKPLTESQANANIFGTRAEAADKIMRSLEDKISTTGLATKRGLENIPIVGGPMGALANNALSANQQKVEQSQRDFVNAVLRKESGASISPSEFQNAIKQYFPQPGDSKAVIEQKRANREIEIAGLKTAAGKPTSVMQQNPQANQPFAQPQAQTISWNDLK